LLWIFGRWPIRLASNVISKALHKRHPDKTIAEFVHSGVIARQGFFGVETTTFAALLAATGIAIGAERSGLLSNFAALDLPVHPATVQD
jgi:small conductance mechanosensitive channel